MKQVPEIFSKFINSFSGCLGGNPDAPIWIVRDHGCNCEIPIDPQKRFANPIENIDALLRPLPKECKCAPSISRLINSIDGSKESDINLVFKPAGAEKDQPVLMLSVSPICVGLLEDQVWKEKPAMKTNDGLVTLAQYTGLPTYKDYVNFLISGRGKLFREAEEQKAPKIILCQGFLKANEYFKFFGADRRSVVANDFYLAAPVLNPDGSVRSIIFVTEMIGFGAGDLTPENELELQQAGLEIRHEAHKVFGNGWLGRYSGELLTEGK